MLIEDSGATPGRLRTGAAFFGTLTIAAALSLLPSTAEAGGDSVYGNRGGGQLSETEHRVTLDFDRGYAHLKVRRTVHNGIERHDEAQFWLDIPGTSVATGLRSLGELDGKPKWFEAELLEAEAAAARYEALTGIGGYYPKDPALLSWRDQTYLALQVFPVAPGTEKTVEYDLDMPAVWADGRWHISLPSLGTDALPPTLVLEPSQQLDQLFVNGEVVARGHQLTLDTDVEISLAPRDPAPFALELASIDTGARHLAQWRLTLAPEVSTVPRNAKIVLVLDLSRSVAGDIEAQRRTALTYLEHFADPSQGAEVALLGFDREVRSLSSGFVSVAEATQLLQDATLNQRNGSELGLALARADELLGAAGKRDARRIVVLSDLETASRVTPATVKATAEHSKAIIHLVVAGSSPSADLGRDDAHAWAPLAAATEGVVWWASAPDDWADDDDHAYGREVFEELARPVRIDELAVRIDGARLEDPDLLSYYDPTLDEGQGLEGLALSATPATKFVVEGKLWNTPLHERAKPSRAQAERWSALVFGSELLWELSEPEMMTLAMRGGAVSPVTSYLAIEPGVRPSTEGLDDDERFGGGFGVGSGVGLGSGGGRYAGSGVDPFDKQAWLESELGEGWRRCGGTSSAVEVTLETRTTEILDVGLKLATVDAGLEACMAQVTWSVELPSRFAALEHWHIKL